jgi:predicted RNase H-like nuclease (RuvC/YqgF family)
MSEETSRPNYEQVCRELECENKELKMQVQELSHHIQYKEREIARLEGRIAGLEFAIRCNGVSGAEVGI